MDIKNINLSKLKVVIFDFDDTLAIHKDADYKKHRGESEDKRLVFCVNAYQNSEDFYENIEPCLKSKVLYKFINELRNKNIKMYCLSGMSFSFHFKAKQSFINRHYGDDIELISSASQELKLPGVKIIKRIVDCELNEILFIDDNKEVIELMKSNGINAFLVNELVDE